MKMQNTIKLLMISNWLSIDIGIHTIWYGVGSHQPLVGSFFTNKLATNKKNKNCVGKKTIATVTYDTVTKSKQKKVYPIVFDRFQPACITSILVKLFVNVFLNLFGVFVWMFNIKRLDEHIE